MRLRILIALAALAVVAPPAGAAPAIEGATFGDSALFLIGPVPGATHVREVQRPLFVRGTLRVSFRSDAASGCAALGACAYSGTIVYKPADAQLLEVSFLLHGRTHHDSTLILGSLNASGSDEVYARVIRQLGAGSTAVCADALPGGGFVVGHPNGAGVVFPLTDGLSATRCAGPLPSDFAPALPALRLAAPVLRGAHADLRRTASFAGHGFAGTVSSTLQFTAGPSISPVSGSTLPPGGRPRRFRFVQRNVRVASESGALTFDVRGTPDAAVCILLDSCGLTGTITLTPGLPGASGTISAGGPATRPEAYYVRVLSGRGPRLAVTGELGSDSAGTLQTSVRQAAACADTTAGRPGVLTLATVSGRLRVQYGAQGILLSGAAADRTRCPGPQLGLQPTLASGSVPRAALGAHTATVVLHPGPAFQDDGYAVMPRGQVTLTLRFGRITQTVFHVVGP